MAALPTPRERTERGSSGLRRFGGHDPHRQRDRCFGQRADSSMSPRIQPRFIRNVLPLLSALMALMNAAQARTFSDGVLGQRFAGAHADLVDFEHLTDYGCSTGIALNLPLRTDVDLGLGLAYGWLSTGGRSIREQSVTASAVWHASSRAIRPFVGASVGHDWVRDYFRWRRQSDSAARWAGVIGLEIPVHAVTVTPTLGYSDWVEDRWVGATIYGIEVNYWFTRILGGYAGVARHDFDGDGGSSSVYRAGMRLKF